MCGTTYWTYGIEVMDGDGSYRAVLSASADALADCLQRATADAMYYLAIGYQRVRVVRLEERCRACHNEGTIRQRRARSVRDIRCPSCAGKKATGLIPAFDVAPSENVHCEIRERERAVA